MIESTEALYIALHILPKSITFHIFHLYGAHRNTLHHDMMFNKATKQYNMPQLQLQQLNSQGTDHMQNHIQIFKF